MGTYEQKYNIALDWARKVYPHTCGKEKEDLERVFPDLKESEDERIRNEIIAFIEQAIHRGGGTPIPKEKEDKWLAYLEKQKELAVIPDELVKNYKLFCEQGGRESALLINAINGFNKQKEQKPTERIEDSVKFEEGFKAGRESGLRDGKKYVLNNLDSYGLCKSAELSEEDERMLTGIIARGCSQVPPYAPALREEQMEWLMNRLKSLRPQPHWKPSEEQMEELLNALIPGKDFDCDILAELYGQLKNL